MNGNNEAYNKQWCDERHSKIDKEFVVMWEKLKTVESRLWAVLLLLFANLGGILVLIFKNS